MLIPNIFSRDLREFHVLVNCHSGILRFYRAWIFYILNLMLQSYVLFLFLLYILIPHIITAGRLLYKHIWHCPQIQYIVTIYKIIKQLKNFAFPVNILQTPGSLHTVENNIDTDKT